MKIRIYHSKINSYRELKKKILDEDGYVSKKIIQKDRMFDTQFELFVQIRPKSNPSWVTEIATFFEITLSEFDSNQYNAVITAVTSNNIYLIPFGRAYSFIEKLSHLDFGLDFAERTLPKANTSLKTSTYILQNKMREITNYKERQNDRIQASESILSISGKFSDEDFKFFGSSVECGYSVALSKNFEVGNVDNLQINDNFKNLFNNIDEVLKRTPISAYPRLHYIDKGSDEDIRLDNLLLNSILEYNVEVPKDSIQVSLNINRIVQRDGRIDINSIENDFNVFIKRKKTATLQSINLDSLDLIQFIKTQSQHIIKLSDVSCEYGEQTNTYTSPLKDNIFCEIELDDRVYVLDNGRWGYLSESFFTLVESKLSDLDQYMSINNLFDAPINVGTNENEYIADLILDSSYIELHKKFILHNGIQLELADIYDLDNDSLIAIKSGTETSKALYSIDQSTLSMHMLANANDFNISDYLMKETGIPVQQHEHIQKIISSRNVCLLWIVHKTPRYVHDSVSAGDFKLNDFNSFLLKLKIIDWFDFALDNGFSPSIIFAKEL